MELLHVERKKGVNIYMQIISNLIGQKFNKLTVINFSHKKNGRKYWMCQCDCGNNHVVEASNLKRGEVKSCGCLKKKLLDLTGKKFGFLTPIELIKNGKNRIWKCLCDCGKESFPHHGSIVRGETVSCGCYHISLVREILRKAKGSNHPRWRADLTDDERLLNNDRSSIPENWEWKSLVLKRDNWTCQLTGQKRNICVHHLYSWNTYPNLRFIIENGVTLSEDIHKLFHSLYGYGNNTPEQFGEFEKRYNNNEFKNL